VVAVSEEEIAEGLRGFGQAGFCVEPTSAVVWKGLEKLRGEEGMGPDEKVVLILSGHGLKAASALAALLG
jgi:threonine synthase